MDDQRDEFDPKLEALFKREHTHLPAEPFSSTALRAIAADRRRAALTKRLLQAAGLLVLIAVSPRLIDGSVWLSARLDELFTLASSWLATPYGLVAAAALAALVWLALRRALVW